MGEENPYSSESVGSRWLREEGAPSPIWDWFSRVGPSMANETSLRACQTYSAGRHGKHRRI